MLEFPGGKVERRESPPVALARELVEEWGPQASTLGVGPIADVLHHVYPPPGPEVLLCVYHVDASSWPAPGWRDRLHLEPGVAVEDYDVNDLPLEDFLEADRPFARRIREGDVRFPAR